LSVTDRQDSFRVPTSGDGAAIRCGKIRDAFAEMIRSTKIIAEEATVDWIEQIFGFSPDGGDGSTEALIVVACTIALATLIVAFSPKLRGYLRQRFTRGPLGS
jgi:hypothetical protein